MSEFLVYGFIIYIIYPLTIILVCLNTTFCPLRTPTLFSCLPRKPGDNSRKRCVDDMRDEDITPNANNVNNYSYASPCLILYAFLIYIETSRYH